MMSKQEFAEKLGYVSGSSGEKAILNLDEYGYSRLLEIVDVEKDDLIHVDSEGCCVNFGSVGSKGIRVNF